MHRRDLLKLGAGASIAATAIASPFVARSSLAQEVTSVTLLMQHGLPYVAMMTMNELKLVEKHAAKAGLPNLKTEYRSLAGATALLDALLSGQMHGGIIGVPSIVALWNRTAGTPQEVRGLCALNSMPYVLVTNNKNVKTIRDFTSTDKIALPAAKISAHAICLQMAAAKEWGDAEYARLDPLTISRAHPEAAAAVMSGNNEINSHYAAAPYFQYELETPGVHQVLKSYETTGGPVTTVLMMMTKAFHDQNPKTTAAIYAAIEEANAFVNANPTQAAEIYLKTTNDKRAGAARVAAMIADPDNVWTTTPQKAMTFASFMHKVGTAKKVPPDWKDMFFPVAHALNGS